MAKLNLPTITLLGAALTGASFLTATAAEPATSPASQAEQKIAPSRYAGTDTDAYIRTLGSRLAIATRSTDPFGQAQDPMAKPTVPKVTKTSPSKTTPGSTAKPFNEIVKQIRVTTVMPGENRFLVGTRSISAGDSFPLVSQGKRYQVQVVEVTAEHILFRDLESSDNGELRLDVMPQGMSRGIRGVLAPGMQSSKADAPLELDSPGSVR